jgi:hypothetical protein
MIGVFHVARLAPLAVAPITRYELSYINANPLLTFFLEVGQRRPQGESYATNVPPVLT